MAPFSTASGAELRSTWYTGAQKAHVEYVLEARFLASQTALYIEHAPLQCGVHHYEA